MTTSSKFDVAVAKILVDAGYIKDAQEKIINKKKYLEVQLAYKNRIGAMSDFKIVSRPSRHMYMGYKELHPVKQGYGLAVLSTPSGVMSNRQARKAQVGGEYLFQVW